MPVASLGRLPNCFVRRRKSEEEASPSTEAKKCDKASPLRSKCPMEHVKKKDGGPSDVCGKTLIGLLSRTGASSARQAHTLVSILYSVLPAEPR